MKFLGVQSHSQRDPGKKRVLDFVSLPLAMTRYPNNSNLK